jgi:hypothetical protein
MAVQLGANAAVMESSHVTVYVLPFWTDEHAEMGGSLTLCALPDSPTVAWLEGSQDGTIVDGPNAVADRRESYDLLRAQVLSPPDSAAMICSKQALPLRRAGLPAEDCAAVIGVLREARQHDVRPGFAGPCPRPGRAVPRPRPEALLHLHAHTPFTRPGHSRVLASGVNVHPRTVP